MSLDAVEFIRRFLLHVLPSGFVKIRHFGFLSNRNRQEMVRHCRELLPPSLAAPLLIEPQLPLCPLCKVGYLDVIDWGHRPTTATGAAPYRQTAAVDSYRMTVVRQFADQHGSAHSGHSRSVSLRLILASENSVAHRHRRTTMGRDSS
jgi:hypothetical protein